MPKTAEDLRRRADELRRQYQKIVHEAKIQERLEEQKRREAAEREENAFNKSFVEFAKTLPTNTNGVSLYEYIVKRMKSAQANSSAAAGSDDQNSASAD